MEKARPEIGRPDDFPVWSKIDNEGCRMSSLQGAMDYLQDIRTKTIKKTGVDFLNVLHEEEF